MKLLVEDLAPCLDAELNLFCKLRDKLFLGIAQQTVQNCTQDLVRLTNL